MADVTYVCTICGHETTEKKKATVHEKTHKEKADGGK